MALAGFGCAFCTMLNNANFYLRRKKNDIFLIRRAIFSI